MREYRVVKLQRGCPDHPHYKGLGVSTPGCPSCREAKADRDFIRSDIEALLMEAFQ